MSTVLYMMHNNRLWHAMPQKIFSNVRNKVRSTENLSVLCEFGTAAPEEKEYERIVENPGSLTLSRSIYILSNALGGSDSSVLRPSYKMGAIDCFENFKFLRSSRGRKWVGGTPFILPAIVSSIIDLRTCTNRMRGTDRRSIHPLRPCRFQEPPRAHFSSHC